jgi:hypothetical protein
MDIFKDTFLGYSIYIKYYKRKWKEQGYYAKKNGKPFECGGQTYFNNKAELYAKLREAEGFKPARYTDAYNIAIQWYKDENNKSHNDYEEIGLLIGQYYYGIEAQKDLKRKLMELGLMK